MVLNAMLVVIVFWGYALVRNRTEQFEAEHAFVGEVVDCARRTDVEFAFPTRTVHMVQ